MKTLALSLILSVASLAGQATVRWNANPELGVTYQVMRDGVMIASTDATEAIVTVQAGDVLTVRALKHGLTSAPSNSIMVVEVQTSSDLKTWTPSGHYSIPADKGTLFTRLKLN